MLRQLDQIPYIKDLVKRLRRDPSLRQICGYGKQAPCEAHFTQMKKRIGAEGFRIIEAWIRHEALKTQSQPASIRSRTHTGSMHRRHRHARLEQQRPT